MPRECSILSIALCKRREQDKLFRPLFRFYHAHKCILWSAPVSKNYWKKSASLRFQSPPKMGHWSPFFPETPNNFSGKYSQLALFFGREKEKKTPIHSRDGTNVCFNGLFWSILPSACFPLRFPFRRRELVERSTRCQKTNLTYKRKTWTPEASNSRASISKLFLSSPIKHAILCTVTSPQKVKWARNKVSL